MEGGSLTRRVPPIEESPKGEGFSLRKAQIAKVTNENCETCRGKCVTTKSPSLMLLKKILFGTSKIHNLFI
jgi:predicted methyltransferase